MSEAGILVEVVTASGKRCTLTGQEGQTLRDLAIHNDVPGILGECGGHCSCGTCHVIVDERWIEVVGRVEPNGLEDGLLDLFEGQRDTSRLSCQITLTEALDGLVVKVPEE